MNIGSKLTIDFARGPYHSMMLCTGIDTGLGGC